MEITGRVCKEGPGMIWLGNGGCIQLRAWIYPSNFDVCYMVQETQSYNWVLKLNLYLYVYFQLFVFVLLDYLTIGIFSQAFMTIKIMSYRHVSYMQLIDCLCLHNIAYITYLNIQKMTIQNLNTLVNILSIW